jgi:GntR family transcriptional regulator/MocR family aminotransferase
VVLENPTFPNVISIFSSLQANIIPIGTDDEGMQVEALNTPDALDAHIVHTTPSNQYPLGGKMSLTRRMELIQWAQTHNKLIIENDYEHEINNSKNPIPSIFSLDTSQRTIFLGTFNRILHPSIRLGYMLVPPYLLPTIKALQMHSHRFVPQSIQVVMQAFINQNHLFKHIRSAIAEAALRKKLFINFFEKYIDTEVILKNNATPSFHLIAFTKEHAPDVEFVKNLETAGISTHALSKCYIGEPTQQGLILGYSSVSKTFMQQSIQKMGQIIK